MELTPIFFNQHTPIKLFFFIIAIIIIIIIIIVIIIIIILLFLLLLVETELLWYLLTVTTPTTICSSQSKPAEENPRDYGNSWVRRWKIWESSNDRFWATGSILTGGMGRGTSPHPQSIMGTAERRHDHWTWCRRKTRTLRSHNIT